MRLLQLNAWSIRLVTRIEDMIAKESPDIITLQEVFESDSDLWLFPTLKRFVNKVGFNYYFFSPVHGLELIGRPAEFGNAIISNITINHRQTIFTHLQYNNSFHYKKDDYNIRNFQHITIKDSGSRTVHVINHHGYHIPDHKRGNELTLEACRLLVNYAVNLQGPVVIAGDFNLEPDSESLNLINHTFRNLTKEYSLTTTRTNLTHKTEVCDYIFVNDLIKVNDFYISSVIASDHCGLLLDFEVQQFE